MRRVQSGAVLLLCVLLLASLSLLGLAAGTDALLQERMGANLAASTSKLRSADRRLRALETQLMALPGFERPPGCPDACLAALPAGTWLREVHHRPPDAAGNPEISWFWLQASFGAPPEVVRSILARPWGDPAWSDPDGFCPALSAGIACGRVGWERLPP